MKRAFGGGCACSFCVVRKFCLFRRHSLSDPGVGTARRYVLDTLRGEILRGRHRRGDRLRQEEVAARLRVSTTPVREALRDLVGEGLIALDAHRGAVVRGLTLGELREIYELRILLEPMLVARTVAGVSGEQLERARGVQTLLDAGPAPEQWAVLNEAFHAVLHEAGRASQLARLVGGLAKSAEPYVALSLRLTAPLLAANNADHRAILDAYARGDVTGATHASAAHLARTLAALEGESSTGQEASGTSH